MATKMINLEDADEDTKTAFMEAAKYHCYKTAIPLSESLESIPFLGRLITRYTQAHFVEGLFFFLKSGDPVVDQKMVNAILIRKYEMKFGLLSGVLWGSIFAFLPALKGSPFSTRLFFFGVPFSLIYYRSFRRGYDQVLYVGTTYLEIIAKQKVILKYLHETDGYLADFKESLMKRPDYLDILRFRGVEPFGTE
ncbi:hypothetical protein SteCoe_25288 [Stentor coeruleus]|uniref:Transmembrane protein n=1 Tax=Stentor coeruleus TaxID=5963 RepID=A0A1R2BFQ5_9CILI|nr:hypothetical protein SteCoe_25288 [Stentor coeruleus]